MSNQVGHTWGTAPGGAAANVCNSLLNCQNLFEPILNPGVKSRLLHNIPSRKPFQWPNTSSLASAHIAHRTIEITKTPRQNPLSREISGAGQAKLSGS